MSQDFEAPAAPLSTARLTSEVFLISALGLFLELLLIRWVSTEIRIFAYLQNTVLVVCFLGLGMGCWDSRRRPFVLRELLVPLGILVALLAIPTTRVALGEISTLFAGFNDLLIWSPGAAEGWGQLLPPLVGLVLTFLLMALLWETLAPVGRLLGQLVGDHPRTIRAYSANVAGSLCGIWLFVSASALYLPPAAWFAVFAAGAVYFLGAGGRSKLGDAGFLAAIVLLAGVAGYERGWSDVRWSPYQKLAARELTPNAHEATEAGLPLRRREHVHCRQQHGLPGDRGPAATDRGGRPGALPPGPARVLPVRPAGPAAPEPAERAHRRGRQRE
jgi:hypothetical protein